MEWKHGMKSGQIVAGGHGQGSRADQLHQPTDLIIDKETDTQVNQSDDGSYRIPGDGFILDSDCRIRRYPISSDK